MRLYCALVGARGGPIDIDIDASLPVSKLKKAIVAEKARRIQCDADELQLFYAKNKEGWLRSDNQHVKKMFEGAIPDEIRALLINPIDALTTIDAAFAGELTKQAIYVLVVDPERLRPRMRKIDELYDEKAISSWEPSFKNPVLDRSTVPNKDPMRPHDVAVPIETIDAYQQIKKAFAKPPDSDRPLFLLCGPRRFGKKSIVNRVIQWIENHPHFDDVKCVFVRLFPCDVNNEASFWSKLGRLLDVRSLCFDQVSFFELATHDHKQFFIVIENMDMVFENQNVAFKLLTALSSWKNSVNFIGFIGIGSLDLLHHKMLNDDGESRTFNDAHILKVQPFSHQQMGTVFEILIARYGFPLSLQKGIMKYSGGAPGVFGSLVRFTIDESKWMLEWNDWEAWFKMEAFSTYSLVDNGSYYKRIQTDLQKLNELEWDALKFVPQNDGMLTISDVENKCSITASNKEEKSIVGPLLKMGVVMQQRSGNLAAVSKLMHRICVEAVPVPDINQVGCMQDPIKLLSLGLRNMNAKTVTRHIARNTHTQYESAFHSDLYASIRGILKNTWFSRSVFADVKTLCLPKKSDIFVSNGETNLMYELRSNLSSESIKLAADQADAYRRRFKIDHMIIVNFVAISTDKSSREEYTIASFPKNQTTLVDNPESLLKDQLQAHPATNIVKEQTRVHVIYVMFPDACDFYVLHFLAGNNEIRREILHCM